MVDQSLALTRRLFPERQLLLRSGENVRYVSLPGWAQMAMVLSLITMVGGVGGLAGAYHNLHKAIHRKEAEISQAVDRVESLSALSDALGKTDGLYMQTSQQLDAMRQQLDTATADNEALKTSIDGAEARIAVLDKTRIALEQRLTRAEKSLNGKTGNVAALQQQLAQSRTELQTAEQSRVGLQKKLSDLQAASQSASDRSNQLKSTLASRQHDLEQLADQRSRLRSQYDQQSAVADDSGSSARLERLIASTGLDINRLLEKLNAEPSGLGGPYVAYDPAHVAQADRVRQEALVKLAKSLPLASPLEQGKFESPFGERIDPFNHRPAFHPGIDLSAPYRTPVLATAPGTVTFVGTKNGYGKLVEVTHDFGIVTLYSHLHRSTVAVGQKVQLHQEVGELGSTGRSTGPHVLYEVHVDGQPVDPMKFMDAGKGVVQISADAK